MYDNSLQAYMVDKRLAFSPQGFRDEMARLESLTTGTASIHSTPPASRPQSVPLPVVDSGSLTPLGGLRSARRASTPSTGPTVLQRTENSARRRATRLFDSPLPIQSFTSLSPASRHGLIRPVARRGAVASAEAAAASTARLLHVGSPVQPVHPRVPPRTPRSLPGVARAAALLTTSAREAAREAALLTTSEYPSYGDPAGGAASCLPLRTSTLRRHRASGLSGWRELRAATWEQKCKDESRAASRSAMDARMGLLVRASSAGASSPRTTPRTTPRTSARAVAARVSSRAEGDRAAARVAAERGIDLAAMYARLNASDQSRKLRASYGFS